MSAVAGKTRRPKIRVTEQDKQLAIAAGGTASTRKRALADLDGAIGSTIAAQQGLQDALEGLMASRDALTALPTPVAPNTVRVWREVVQPALKAAGKKGLLQTEMGQLLDGGTPVNQGVVSNVLRYAGSEGLVFKAQEKPNLWRLAS